jgi:hypothetical protein
MMVSACLFGLLTSPALLTTAPVVEMRGIISRVDLEKKELEVDGRGSTRKTAVILQLEKSTAVLFGTQQATLDDLPIGRRVRIAFEVREGKAVARIIHVNGPKPARRTTPETTRSDANTVAGTLRRVAVTDREIVIVGPGARGTETETTIRVPESTMIYRGEKSVTMRDLKEGEPARVKVSRRDGKLEAIEVQSGSGTAMTTTAKEKSTFVPRLRLALQTADWLLKMLEDR